MSLQIHNSYQARSEGRSKVLYQQNCINAAVVLWVICHLSIFT